MFELEDYSSGFHDGFLNKYADSSGPNLDFYISDSLQDMLDIDIRSEVATLVGGSNEFASFVNDLPSSFDHADSISNDATTGSTTTTTTTTHKVNNAPSWLSEPPWYSSNDYYADVGACVNPISVMPIISSSSMLHRSPKTTLNTNGLRNTSSPPGSPVENKSHLHFSPQQMRISSVRPEQKIFSSSSQTNQSSNASNIILQRKNVAIDSIKKDLSSELRRSPTSLINNNIVSSTSTSTSSSTAAPSSSSVSQQQQQQSRITSTATSTSTSTSSSLSSMMSVSTSNGIIHSNGIINSNGILSTGTNTIKLAPGIGGLTFANSITYNKLKQQSTTTKSSSGTLTANGNTIVLKRDRDSSPLHNMATLNGSTSYLSNQLSGKILARNVIHTKNISPATHLHSNNSTGTSNVTSPLASLTPTLISVKPSKIKVEVESEFPKPAYSYSCLIAMALKNSRSGSLPVSEIYSFMCEHFPYFKTARSGWKNSVRHNLSMNKCFEKVEKPATNGGQRKGCLWAMNPQKILKMDEEVQKWSRKDPMAIRNAMVFPEHLEALERGEMKHGSTGESDVELDSQSEVEETSDSEELDQELDETIVETHEMYVEEDDDSGPQQHRDFDIEVEDIYDAIDMEDDKEAVRLAINGIDMEDDKDAVHLAMNTIEMDDDKEAVRLAINSNIIEMSSSPTSSTDNDYNSPKRARLSVNYSIGPAGEVRQQFKQHSSSHHHQHHQQQQQHQQQIQHHQHTQILTTSSFQPQNRRKMQLVNRIA